MLDWFYWNLIYVQLFNLAFCIYIQYIALNVIYTIVQDPDTRNELKLILKDEQRRIADARGTDALKRLQEELLEREAQEKGHIIVRQLALEVEKARAAEIAGLPPPKPDPLAQLDNKGELEW